MAITSLDGVIAGTTPPADILKVGGTMEAVGVMNSFFYNTGNPGAAAAPTGLNGAALTTYAGQIPFTNPSSGNSYLARLTASATLGGMLLLVDRLWHNGSISITTTTAQAITFPTLPARDRNGSTNGEGVMVGLEVSGAVGNGAVTNTTMIYTNSTATGGAKTATMASFPASATAGTFVPFQLAAGDTGVRSITSLTLGTTYVSGTIHMVAYRVLAALPCPLPNVGAELNAVTGGFPRMYDNTVPMLLWVPTATTAVNVVAQMSVAQG
jgi:hypothetical protein